MVFRTRLQHRTTETGVTTDLSLVADEQWREARRRAVVVRPLAERARCPRSAARAAATELGLSERQIYVLVRRCREAGGELTALLPAVSGGGRGKSRLPPGIEAVIRRIVDEIYLTPQKNTAAVVVREIQAQCRRGQMQAPSASTIRRRIGGLPLAAVRRRGEELPETRPVYGPSPVARDPLDLVQMDHTQVDLILVDPVDRAPIGRPWLTVAIDVYSRCIAGFHLTLEPPSATSVGLCLTHVASAKQPWLELRGVEASWPVAGKPRRLGVDNGAEFHSAAFERGCEQHGIAIDWRPPGRPHFGGIVERVIGTLMRLVHALPGTTFADIVARGGYDSDKTACLTLDELERWLAVAITKYYHLRPHEGLEGELPLRRYEAGMKALAAEGRSVPAARDARAFLIDFLPVVRRSLRRDGITIDHITYFSSALKPWIQGRERRPDRLVIRRDPRDLSRIFVLDPRDDAYLEVPYRTLSRPTVTLWEHRLALRRLRARRRCEMDEATLFAAIEEMRAVEREATSLTRAARRNRARQMSRPVPPPAQPTPDRATTGSESPGADVLCPFDDLEEW